MYLYRLLGLVVLLFSAAVQAEIVSVPLTYTSHPAKDLVDENGKSLSVIEAKKLWRQTQDLSHLNPKETDIWKNTIGKSLTPELDDLAIDKEETFSYIDKVISPIGSFRFVVNETKRNGAKRNFNIWLSKDSRSILLRKNLLRKLGYIVPKIQHRQQVRIQFKGMATLKGFLEDLETSTFADSNRWKVEVDEQKYILVLQDVLILGSNTKIYNLAMGLLGSETIKHRRVLNSLSLAYALVDVRESVDGLTWHMGRVDNKVFILDIISGDAFSTTYYDAKWMYERLKKLTDKDYQEIVDYAYLPKSVGMLLKEKLMSRFNSLVSIFGKNDNEKIVINPEVTDSSGELVGGRLTQDNWQGHASRYSFDDTESPLSKSEMVAYFKSKFYSGIIQNLVSYVNEKLLYETDIQEAAIEKAVEAQKEQFIKLLETGKFERIPFSSWAIPTAKGHIAASRDIITGSYLGTDNMIQIADSLEFIGEVGAFVGTLGLPTEYQVYATGNARFSRAYTHVKSIKSIKKALKEPYRNIIVPYMKRKKARSLVGMIDDLRSEEFSQLEGEERTARVEEIFNELDEVMAMGDSLIISNNLILAGSLNGGVQVPFPNTDKINAELVLQLNTRKVNIWRLHITRSGENTFQIYKSRANAMGYGGGIQASALIPIVSLNLDRQSGEIQTAFHSLEFNNQDDTKTMIRNLSKLRQVLVENSVELMQADQKPFFINHQFKEQVNSYRNLTHQKLGLKLKDRLKVSHPEGYDVEFLIRSTGMRKGTNYIQVGYDVLNAALDQAFENEDISFTNTESGNPGDSFYGSSFSRQTMTEVPDLEEKSEIPFENYAQVKSQWKGWSANRSKLLEIKRDIDTKYGRDVFSDEMFYDTDEINLYTVNVILSLYASGIDYLVRYDHQKLMNLVERELIMPWPKNMSHYYWKGKRRINMYRRKRDLLIKRISQAHYELSANYRKLLSHERQSKNITFLVDTLEAVLPFKVFSQLVGGDDHFYLKGTINGFRVGRENGEESIESHAIGEFGSEFSAGIADTLRKAIKISQGELGAHWFLRRL